jgi:hypothetical protein
MALHPWLPACNRLLDPFANNWRLQDSPPHQLLHSSALGETAVRADDRISFWRMRHGGKVIKFVARIQVQEGCLAACYAGTCLILFRQDNQVTMMCRHDGAFQDLCSFRVQQSVCDIQGYGDVFALSSPATSATAATVYQQRAVREFVVLCKITNGHPVLYFMPFVYFIPGWRTTICGGWKHAWRYEFRRAVFSFRIYQTWSSTSAFTSPFTTAFDTFRDIDESPVENVRFHNRCVAWVHECMGMLSVLDVRKGSVWRPCFMFSCDPDQYAFTRNVSDVKQAWMGVCVQ